MNLVIIQFDNRQLLNTLVVIPFVPGFFIPASKAHLYEQFSNSPGLNPHSRGSFHHWSDYHVNRYDQQNDTLTKTAFYVALFAGVFAVPVFFSGEGAEEIVEHLPGVSEELIERHEALATLAFPLVSTAAIFSITGLMLYKKKKILYATKLFVFVLNLATAGIMIATAHLGGKIRHSEIRSDFIAPSENRPDNILEK